LPGVTLLFEALVEALSEPPAVVIEPVAQTLLQAHAPQDVGLIDVVNPACCAGWGAQVVCATGSIMQKWW